MNTKTSFLFQISEYKWTVLLFYLVSLLIIGTSITLSDGSTVSGLEVATCFFLLVCGMNFQSALMFHLQMGSTRRTFFKGWLLSSCAVCLMTAALNLTVLLISQLIGIPMGSPIFAIPISSVVLRMAVGLLYQFATFLLFISLGYLLSVLFYRLNKMGSLDSRHPVGLHLACSFVLSGAIRQCARPALSAALSASAAFFLHLSADFFGGALSVLADGSQQPEQISKNKLFPVSLPKKIFSFCWFSLLSNAQKYGILKIQENKLNWYTFKIIEFD